MDYKERKKTRAYKKRRKRRVFLVIKIAALVVVALGIFAVSKFARLGGGKLDLSSLFVSSSVGKGYQNIVIFGIDSRETGADGSSNAEAGAHSDTIMLASLDHNTKDINLVSIYRDSYFDTGAGDYRKLTEAYYFGGAQRAINAINENMDLNVTDYVTVDFSAVAEAADLLGGLDIDLTWEEVEQINHICKETSRVTGKDYEPLTEAGVQHLNGVQVTSYARIRYTEGSDYRRTERQRHVIEKMMEKAKGASLKTLNSMIDEIFPMIATSLSLKDMLSLAKGLLSYDMADNSGFPYEKTTMMMGSKGDCVIPATLESNVRQLHQTLFRNESYEVPERVRTISNQIIYETGVQ